MDMEEEKDGKMKKIARELYTIMEEATNKYDAFEELEDYLEKKFYFTYSDIKERIKKHIGDCKEVRREDQTREG